MAPVLLASFVPEEDHQQRASLPVAFSFLYGLFRSKLASQIARVAEEGGCTAGATRRISSEPQDEHEKRPNN